MKHFCRGEKTNRGEHHGNAKLTEESVREIRRLYNEGQRYDEIAPKFGVTKYTVASVIKGRTWSFVSDKQQLTAPTTVTKRKRKSPNTQRNTPPSPNQMERCKEFFALKQTGLSYAEIGKRYKVGRKTVYEYIRRYEILMQAPAVTVSKPAVAMVV